MFSRLKISQPHFMLRAIAACWLVTKLLSYKLWLSDRLLPTVPVSDIFYSIPNGIHFFLFMVMLVCLLCVVIFPQKKWICAILVVAEILSCLMDQNRWQPWEYQFTFMFAIYLFLKDSSGVKTYWQIIFIGIYFFSGLGKLNSGFIMQVWNGRIMHQWLNLSLHNVWMFRIGYALPVFEMAAALLLLFQRTRMLGVIMICLMHIFILTMLGPLGLHFKDVIWPWNVAMLCCVIGLFREDALKFTIAFQKKTLAWIVILFWWVLPCLQPFGFWDSYFSSSLYSGKLQYLYICVSDSSVKNKMIDNYMRTTRTAPCDSMLSVFKWAVLETNNAPNPELRVFKKIVQRWEETMDSAHNDRFFIHHPRFSNDEWVELTGK